MSFLYILAAVVIIAAVRALFNMPVTGTVPTVLLTLAGIGAAGWFLFKKR